MRAPNPPHIAYASPIYPILPARIARHIAYAHDAHIAYKERLICPYPKSGI